MMEIGAYLLLVGAIARLYRAVAFEVLCVAGDVLGRLGALRTAGRVRELAGKVG